MPLTDTEVDLLTRLEAELWTWVAHCHTSGDLMALGAVLHSLETYCEEGEPDCAVSISLGSAPPVARTEEDLDGQSFGIEISDEGVRMSAMRYVGVGQGLSRDHESETFCVWLPGQSQALFRPDEWFDRLENARQKLRFFTHEICGLPQY
jgi:hypothetical protein